MTKIKVQGVVLQIILWEERKKYIFASVEYGDVPTDLMIIGRPPEKKTIIEKLFNTKKHKFEEWILDRGLELAVARPHDFKEGDMVSIEIDVEKE
jgi:coenzyme F420-reducing hydrogenase gamma subunit